MATESVPASESALPLPAIRTDLGSHAQTPAVSPAIHEEAYDAAWVTFHTAFHATVTEQAERYQRLLDLAKALPEVADREIARTLTEGEQRIAAERMARRAILAETDAHCAALRHALAILAAELTAAAKQVDTLARQVHAALLAEEAGTETADARPFLSAEHFIDGSGDASSADTGADPWALVEAAMRLFRVRTPGSEQAGREPGNPAP
ncbi:MAG: hypothetical protein KatS3mg059_1199 [Thermomicrobiales bacterium]|nr:MAG: hypothetical protein KatS3mg059_1199 [Thermomicrobiales bacterium]